MSRLVLLVFIGSGLGGTCRYGLGAVVQRLTGPAFPFGTLAVNLLGCLVAGFLAAAFDAHRIREEVRVALTVGFLGGFTTFSAFGMDAINLVLREHQTKVIVYVLASVLGGLACVGLGFRAGNTIFIHS